VKSESFEVEAEVKVEVKVKVEEGIAGFLAKVNYRFIAIVNHQFEKGVFNLCINFTDVMLFQKEGRV
jgi:hypothetical protein